MKSVSFDAAVSYGYCGAALMFDDENKEIHNSVVDFQRNLGYSGSVVMTNDKRLILALNLIGCETFGRVKIENVDRIYKL